MKNYIFIFLLLVLISCEKNEITSPSNSNVDRYYPTTLHALSPPELDSLQIKFNNKLLGTKYLAVLDSFGLLGFHRGLSRGNSSISDPAQAIALAKTAVVYLSDFSNVIDTSALSVQGVKHATDAWSTDWAILFKNQSYKGMEVWNTNILVIVADDFILLEGHHYKNIFIPKNKILSKERAKKKLVGKEIYYYCWGRDTVVIADSSINLEKIEQCIYPVVKNNAIELFAAWKVQISPFSWPMWYYFIDVVTGEILGVRQLFIC